jgi:DNA-binding PadR family transcriptional regulator
MAPVFAHGRLRLYLLKLLHESPRHGYEVIRLLEERFQGLYAPSAGTVYPRLAKLEKEGLVTHATEGGRKVYSLTDAGHAELASRADEIEGLEAEIRESVSTLAAEIREDVRDAAGDLRREVLAATRQTGTPPSGSAADRLREEWKEQARRAEEESSRAKEEARDARHQAKAAREAMDSARDEVQRIARQVQDQVQSHTRAGDWQSGLREGLAELTRELGQFGKGTDAPAMPWGYQAPGYPVVDYPGTPPDDTPPSDDPLRDLERLLDRFRDDIRDTARDLGVDDDRLREVRRRLSSATAHITAALRRPTH